MNHINVMHNNRIFNFKMDFGKTGNNDRDLNQNFNDGFILDIFQSVQWPKSSDGIVEAVVSRGLQNRRH
ncbi:unnamed protein product [Ambrosiozyma monospora]|uniref:Unnamed protein product n=1 Tax=Ambrosiozyma monospora TaxID=43982 RepID=A0ACB5T4K6_AMBMO|nr:unnamed protein product [Ambrosiozyma monospora]